MMCECSSSGNRNRSGDAPEAAAQGERCRKTRGPWADANVWWKPSANLTIRSYYLGKNRQVRKRRRLRGKREKEKGISIKSLEA